MNPSFSGKERTCLTWEVSFATKWQKRVPIELGGPIDHSRSVHLLHTYINQWLLHGIASKSHTTSTASGGLSVRRVMFKTICYRSIIAGCALQGRVTLQNSRYVFLCGSTAPSGPGSSHCWGSTITPRHTSLGRTPLDEWLAHRTDVYRTIHNIHKRERDIHTPRGIRTWKPKYWAAADPRLRQRGN